MPYRDAVELTLRLSLYIGSGAILAAGPFAIRDIFATGLVYLALTLAVLTVVFTFLVAQAYFASRRVAVLAALIISASTPCDLFEPGARSWHSAISGTSLVSTRLTSPTTPVQLDLSGAGTTVALFGLASLWAVRKERPFLAGLFGMLAALSWQPGLLFVGAARVWPSPAT